MSGDDRIRTCPNSLLWKRSRNAGRASALLALLLLSGCRVLTGEDLVADEVIWNHQFTAALLLVDRSGSRDDLWLYDRASDNYAYVSDKVGNVGEGDWSPNGTMFIYSHWPDPEHGEHLLGVIHHSGGKVVLEKREQADGCAWTPWDTLWDISGTATGDVLVETHPRTGLQKTLLDDSKVVKNCCFGQLADYLLFAPDGSFMLVAQRYENEQGRAAIHRFADRSTTVVPLIPTGNRETSISPDSTMLTLHPRGEASETILVCDMEGTTIATLPPSRVVAWSPDSKRLLLDLSPRKDGQPPYDYMTNPDKTITKGGKNIAIADVRTGTVTPLCFLSLNEMWEERRSPSSSSVLRGTNLGYWLAGDSGVVLDAREYVKGTNGYGYGDWKQVRLGLDGTLEAVDKREGHVTIVRKDTGEMVYLPHVAKIKR